MKANVPVKSWPDVPSIEELSKGWIEQCPDNGMCQFRYYRLLVDVYEIDKDEYGRTHYGQVNDIMRDANVNDGKAHWGTEYHYWCCTGCKKPYSYDEMRRINKVFGHKSPLANLSFDDILNF